MEIPFYFLVVSFLIYIRKNRIRRLLHWGPIIALSVIAFISTCVVKCQLLWWPLTNISALTNLIFLFGWLHIILYNFFRASHVGPGFVCEGWKPECKDHKQFLQFCTVCIAYKTPRSHHCSKCQRCIMKMDHHCPWINNCVGHFNHCNFVLFLFFTPLGCIHALCVLVPSTYRCFYKNYYMTQGSDDVPLVDMSIEVLICCMLAVGNAIGVIVAVGGLFVMQLQNLLRNETGIENWIKEKADYRKGGEKFLYPYDLGRWKNIRMVIYWGDNPKLDGIWWPVREGCHQYTLTVEQIQQKNEKRYRSLIFNIVKKFGGSWVPMCFGCGVCCCPPCVDEHRLKVQPGDRILVSRFRKHWLYGEKMLAHEINTMTFKIKRERGWFPKKCGVKSNELFIPPSNGIQNVEKLNVLADEKFLKKTL